MRICSILFLIVITVNLHAAENRMPVGGGSTDAGFTGAYFPNPNFAGEPAFTRQDVRINFNWREGEAGKGLPVGGASTPGMAEFPVDDFSIRWTGALIPRFDETYTLHVRGEDGLRLSLGAKVLIDSLGKSISKDVAVPMKKGQKLPLVLEYVDRAGTKASAISLAWSSPSTPKEIIEPLSFAQACLHLASRSWKALEFADIVRMPCSFWQDMSRKELPAESLDENGWPLVSDCQIKLSHYGEQTYTGTYKVQFTGQAQVGGQSAGGSIRGNWRSSDAADAEALGSNVAKGIGYDAASNTTTLWFDATQANHFFLQFKDAEISPDQPGLRDLRVYTPVANGASEHHQPGEIYKREARAFFKEFVVLRQHIGTSTAYGATWQDRTLPSYFRRDKPNGAYCFEELIMAANDVGKDLHFCFGAEWDQEKMRKFSQLVRYGSDGVEPYSDYVDNPVYPPLNPNLRIYLEHSNELPWAVYPGFIWARLEEKAKANHPDWQIVNYDGNCKQPKPNATTMLRYHALRMKQMSDAFQEVHADIPGALGGRGRVLCFGQYASTKMQFMLQFLDEYFNKTNPKSPYQGEAVAPSAYLWGGGGAIYYGNTNRFGFMEKEPIPDHGFEDLKLEGGQALIQPEHPAWTFQGTAGIANVETARQKLFTEDQHQGKAVEMGEGKRWAGFSFTVGDKDIIVYQLGRWYPQAKGYVRGSEDMAIINSKGAVIANAEGLKPQKDGAGYQYAWCGRKASSTQMPKPTILKAGETYYLVSDFTKGKPPLFASAATATKPEGISLGDAVEAGFHRRQVKDWKKSDLGAYGFGPLNMVYSTQPLQADGTLLGVAPDENGFKFSGYAAVKERQFDFGKQCAFIKGAGSISCSFSVPADGAYWVNLNLMQDEMTHNRRHRPQLHIYINEQLVTDKSLPQGGYAFDSNVFHYHSSRLIKLTAGEHKLRLEQKVAEAGTMFIDAMHLGSEDAFYGGPGAPTFPAGGRAIGQLDASGGAYGHNAKSECEMAYNWGLVPMTYEGGWAVQADFDYYGMLAWNDLRYGSPATNKQQTGQALRNAFEMWCKKGGYIYAYFYPISRTCGDLNAPLLNQVRAFNNELAVEVETVNVIPGTFTHEDEHYQQSNASVKPWKDYRGGANGNQKDPLTDEVPAYGWKSWIVSAKQTAEYQVSLEASGGKAQLIINGNIVASGASDSGLQAKVKLVPGVHAIKVQSTAEQPVKVVKIAVE